MRRLSPTAVVVLAVAVVVAPARPAAAADHAYVPLLIDEPAGLARTASPVTAGVPLPQGRVRGVANLRVLDAAGAAVPAAFQTLATWPDGSLRWVAADFQASVAASGQARYSLTEDPFTPAPVAPPLTVATSPGYLDIDTGAATFRIPTTRFRPFERVTAGGVEVLGWSASDVVLLAGGTTWTTARDTLTTVTLEESTPLRAVVLARGNFRDLGGSALLGYQARLHFYAGKSTVRMFLTVRNDEPAQHPGNVWDLGSSGSRDIEDLSIFLPLAQPIPLTWSAWGDAPQPETGVPAQDSVLYQESSGGNRWDWSTHVNRSNVVPMTFRGWQLRQNGTATAAGNRARGVLDLSSMAGGIAVGVRQFWQNFPKALRAQVPGDLLIALFPGEFPDVHELQGGEEKTHEVLLYFHAADAVRARVDETFTDLEQPLRARPAWDEALRSGALSRFGPRDPSAFPDWENTIEYMAFDKGDRSFFTQREAIDEYGWRNFGEAFADHETDCGTPCWDCPVSHDNNQYDYDWAALLFWIRDGRREWLELGEQGARHLADIDVYHTTRDTPAYNGGLFWHTTHDTAAFTSTHRTYSSLMSAACTPYLSGGPAPGHLYTEGLLLHGYLSGDRRAFEVARELHDFLDTRYALDDPAPGSGYEPRAWANALRAAVAEFRHSASPAAAALMSRLVADSAAPGNPGIDGRGFGDSMLMVSLGRFLDLAAERGQSGGADAVLARASLGEYARRVRANHTPAFDVLDFRFSEAMWSAYRHADRGDPDRPDWARLGRDYFLAGEQTVWFNAYITNKGLAHTATNGHLHAYFERGRMPAEVRRLLAVARGADVEMSWDATTVDIDGDPLALASYAVHRSARYPTRYSDQRLASPPTTSFSALGDVSDPVPLLFYSVRAVAEPGIEGY